MKSRIVEQLADLAEGDIASDLAVHLRKSLGFDPDQLQYRAKEVLTQVAGKIQDLEKEVASLKETYPPSKEQELGKRIEIADLLQLRAGLVIVIPDDTQTDFLDEEPQCGGQHY